MANWIRNNLVLVSGIVLPVLLVIGFFILNSIPKMLADPPEYDFLLVAYRYDYQNPRDYHLSFEVRDGKLHGVAAPDDDKKYYGSRQFARVYRYHSAEGRFEELVFDLPAGLDSLQEAVTLDLGEAGQLPLDKRKESPDGYQFEYLGYRGRGGILGEIFGMNGNYRSEYVLRKGSTYLDLPQLYDDSYYNQNDVHFMGWITGGETRP